MKEKEKITETVKKFLEYPTPQRFETKSYQKTVIALEEILTNLLEQDRKQFKDACIEEIDYEINQNADVYQVLSYEGGMQKAKQILEDEFKKRNT
jgi:hypothetical protein